MYKLYLFGVIINNYNSPNYRLLTVDKKLQEFFLFCQIYPIRWNLTILPLYIFEPGEEIGGF